MNELVHRLYGLTADERLDYLMRRVNQINAQEEQENEADPAVVGG